jgi:FAD synthetase
VKKILAEIWKLEFENAVTSEEDLKEKLNLTQRKLELLREKGYIEGFKLTDKGRKQIRVAVCGGVFDILHPGHGFMLEKAKAYGDVLVVIVARDETVKNRKRIPIVPEDQRLEMVKLLKPVDIAILGETDDYLRVIERIKPDVIVLGPDQTHNAEYIKEELRKRGLNVEVKRVTEYKECALHSTRNILQRIIERGYPNKRDESL